MDLVAESARLDGVMKSVYDNWNMQLKELDASIKRLSDILASTEKTDMSENATYTITRDERDMKMASKSIILDKINAYEESVGTYTPSGYIQLGSTFVLELVSVDGVRQGNVLHPMKLTPDAVSSGVSGLLSIASPVGSALIGRRPDETIEVQVPRGACVYRVREVY